MEPRAEPARFTRMRQVDDHFECSAEEVCQSEAEVSAAGIWAFGLVMILLAASAFMLIALYAQGL